MVSRLSVEVSIEERVASLEQDVRHLNKQVERGRDELDEATREYTRGLMREQQDSVTGDTNLASALKRSSTGGLHISLIGALWLIVGVILSTLSHEIAIWLQ